MSARERLVWVTAAGQRVDHAVTADDLAAGIGAAGKDVVALCRRRFVAAPLIAEPGDRCTPCVRDARGRATLHTVEQRPRGLGTRGGWLAALVAPPDARESGMISAPRNVHRAPVQWAVCPYWPVVDPDAPMTLRFASDPERTRPRYRLPTSRFRRYVRNAVARQRAGLASRRAMAKTAPEFSPRDPRDR